MKHMELVKLSMQTSASADNFEKSFQGELFLVQKQTAMLYANFLIALISCYSMYSI